jgi:hypothetical protein
VGQQYNRAGIVAVSQAKHYTFWCFDASRLHRHYTFCNNWIRLSLNALVLEQQCCPHLRVLHDKRWANPAWQLGQQPAWAGRSVRCRSQVGSHPALRHHHIDHDLINSNLSPSVVRVQFFTPRQHWKRMESRCVAGMKTRRC